MSWQKCPVCCGSGIGSSYGSPCSVCLGQKIINQISGRPPTIIPVDKPIQKPSSQPSEGE